MRNGFSTVLIVLVLLAVCSTAGCGNVYLMGEAATACETSTMDAYLASQKASADPGVPAWSKAYIEENFRQWRYFVRSARKDSNWGPKLPGEVQAQSQEAIQP